MPTAIRGSSGSPWSRGWSERDRQAVVRGTIFLMGVGLLRFGEIVCGLQIQASVPSLPLLNDSRRIAAAVAVHDTPWQGRAGQSASDGQWLPSLGRACVVQRM